MGNMDRARGRKEAERTKQEEGREKKAEGRIKLRPKQLLSPVTGAAG